MSSQTISSDIINLNVGGTKFSTSRQTLSSTPDSFFTSMLSGRIPTCRDETGAFFIDRDPKLFSIILHFLRTKELDVAVNGNVDISILRHEAEFYGVTSLVRRLMLCEDLERSSCGDVLYTGFIQAPNLLTAAVTTTTTSSTTKAIASAKRCGGETAAKSPLINSNSSSEPLMKSSQKNNNSLPQSRPGNVLRLNAQPPPLSSSLLSSASSSLTAADLQQQQSYNNNNNNYYFTHSRKSSLESSSDNQNYLFNSTDPNALTLSDQQGNNSNAVTPTQVNIITGHHNWIAVVYPRSVLCYKLKDGAGWQIMFQSSVNNDEEIDRVAVYSKHQMNLSSSVNLNNSFGGGAAASTASSSSNAAGTGTASNSLSSPSANASSNSNSNSPLLAASSSPAAAGNNQTIFQQQQQQQSTTLENNRFCVLLAISIETSIRLWIIYDEKNANLIGNFSLNTNIDSLFFIGSQLVTTSSSGKIGVWNSLSQLWQTQDLTPITAFDTAGSFLLLGGQNGVLYYIDMQKFPLRMKDNDLLVTELYRDLSGDSITSISVYLTPKTSNSGNWIEIAYGTRSGLVRVIVQHPETVGHGPQLFQTFSVHRGSVIKVMLTEKYLVSVCSEYNHVRTWNVTRFRGMISTQPGSTPLASFKIVTIDALDSSTAYSCGNDIGPFGDKENHQVFIQKTVPYSNELLVRLSSTGKRICKIKSVDNSAITCFFVHECEGPSRLNSRPRRYLFTGHSNGTIQMWDLTTALELKPADPNYTGGPTAIEFLRQLDHCELAPNSGFSTPTVSNSNINSSCILSNLSSHLAMLTHFNKQQQPISSKLKEKPGKLNNLNDFNENNA